MKLSTSLVAVKKISSSVPRSQFSEDELNRVAELILKVEGIINPLIIRRISFESYEVVDGDFEYYAAAKAKEINARKGEMISAFIIEPENEELITEQIKAFRRLKSNNPGTKELTVKLNQFESLPKRAEELTVKLNQFESLPKKVEELTVKLNQFESLSEQVEELTVKLNQFESLPKKVEELTVKLNQFESLSEQVENIKEMLTQVAEYVKKKEKVVIEPIDYNSKTVKELKAIASERNIKLRASMKKAEIVTAIKEAEALS
ncbi:MAG: Rho termination factor N-terminal domain-containing protein [Aphanothece sp. CMT-3BRIN-NPC111]|nr:Rho termination factor N-terminal domain-containing protein [Aphanothece sp. CMT-3BRIN-NPC111]